MRNVSNALVDEVRETQRIESDYRVAKILGVRQQTISSYRSGRTQMSDQMALRVATLLGKPAAPIFAELAAERAKYPEVEKVWRDAVKALSGKKSGQRGSP